MESLRGGDLRVILLSAGTLFGVLGVAGAIGNYEIKKKYAIISKEINEEVETIDKGLLAISALCFGIAFVSRRK